MLGLILLLVNLQVRSMASGPGPVAIFLLDWIVWYQGHIVLVKLMANMESITVFGTFTSF